MQERKPATAQDLNQVPSEISQIAGAVGMGRLLLAQQVASPSKSFLWGIAATIAVIGGACALVWFANFSKNSGLGDAASEFAKIAFVTFIFGILLAVMAIKSLFVGHRSVYLYDNGVIWRRNRRIEPVPWSRVRELVRWRMGGDTFITGAVLYYVLVTVDGLKLDIAKLDANGDDSFSVKLEDTIRRRGGRIVDGGSYVQLGKPILPLPFELMVLLLLVCVAVVWKVLSTFGVPDAVLLPGPFLAGLTILAIELRTRRPFGVTSAATQAPFGGPFTAIGAIWFAVGLGMIWGSLVGWLMLGLEIAIAIVAVRLIKAHRPLRR
jgi:hypothetical protein